MKRVLVIETLSQIYGGQKMSLTVSELLKESGLFEITWAIPENGELSQTLEKKGYKYECFGNVDLPSGEKGKSAVFQYGNMSLKVIHKLNRMIKHHHIDIIYSPGPASLPWAAICGSIRRLPVIWHLHHIFVDGPTLKLLNICSSFHSVRSIIAVSDAVGKQISNKIGSQKCKTLYNPVNYELYSNGDIKSIAKICPFVNRLAGEDILIMEHIGIIHPTKRQDFTIRLVAEFKNIGKRVHAVFIGKCDERDHNYRDDLKSLALKLGVSDQIHFVGQQDNVYDWLKGADFVFIPSIEGLSLVALEGMAAGVPVIATSECGVGELLRASKAGKTYNEGDDLKSICDTIIASLSDKDAIISGISFAQEHSYERYQKEITVIFHQ